MSLANFMDTLIDYPKAREYARELFERLGELGVLEGDMIEKYKYHVENLVKSELEEMETFSNKSNGNGNATSEN